MWYILWNSFWYEQTAAAAAAKSLQSCLTLCDPIDGSPQDSPIPGILQARTLEWAAISSNAWKWKVKVKSLSRVWLSATHGLQPTRLLCPWDFPGKTTGVGCHCLLWWANWERKISKITQLVNGTVGFKLLCFSVWLSNSVLSLFSLKLFSSVVELSL